MRYVASDGGRQVTLDVGESGHPRHITLGDTTLDVDWQPVGGAAAHGGTRDGADTAAGHYGMLTQGRSFEIFVRALPGDAAARTFEVSIGGRPYIVRLEDARASTLAGLAGSGHERGEVVISAPMPGLVAGVLVAAGDRVETGQTVVVLEAMKMENDLTTPRAGIVKTVRVSKGQTVDQNEVLAVIGDPPGSPPPTEDE